MNIVLGSTMRNTRHERGAVVRCLWYTPDLVSNARYVVIEGGDYMVKVRPLDDVPMPLAEYWNWRFVPALSP